MLSPEQAQRILDGISAGEFIADLCAEVGTNRKEYWRHQQADQEFAAQCARARELSASVNEEDVAKLMAEVKSGDVEPDAARVILNGYTWLAKVRAPKVYGEKMDVAVSGSLTGIISSLPHVERPAKD